VVYDAGSLRYWKIRAATEKIRAKVNAVFVGLRLLGYFGGYDVLEALSSSSARCSALDLI
jgi:hypothetical protein